MFAPLVLLFVLAIAPGCGNGPTRPIGECPECTVPNTTPDSAVEALARHWGERNRAAYESILHPDFVFYFAQEDIENNAAPATNWSRADELQSAKLLFDGAGSGRSVSSISITLTPISGWSDQVAPEFAGTQKATYFVNMIVNYDNGDLSDVRGHQVLYVAPVETTIEGNELTTYQLKYWRDLGFVEAPRSSTESISWGMLKAWS